MVDESGGVIMNHNRYAGNDQYLFCKNSITRLAGFAGEKTRSHDWRCPTGLTGWSPLPSS